MLMNNMWPDGGHLSVLQHDLCFKSPGHDWDRWSTNTRNIEAKQETFSPHSVHCDWGRTSRTRSCSSFTHSEEEEEVPVQILKEDTAWPQDSVTQITAWEIVPLSRPGHWNAPNGSFLSCYLSLSVVLQRLTAEVFKRPKVCTINMSYLMDTL